MLSAASIACRSRHGSWVAFVARKYHGAIFSAVRFAPFTAYEKYCAVTDAEDSSEYCSAIADSSATFSALAGSGVLLGSPALEGAFAGEV